MNPTIVPVSLDRHGQKWFRKFTSYGFAAGDTITPLVAAELAKATVSFPVAFHKQGEDTTLVAVLGIEPGCNLFVAPDGRWVGSYVPARLRSFPFILAMTPDNRQVLCIDEQSGLVVDQPDNERFFEDDGQPTTAMRAIADFLMKVHENRIMTDKACGTIERLGLLEPWTFVVAGEQGPRNVTGLWRVNESRLNQLSDTDFIELRRTGALALAYGQLMSMGHLALLERLATLRVQLRKQASAPLPDNLDRIFEGTGASDEIQIDWSQFKT